MSNPTTRQEFGQYCLRALGAPVLEINVSDEQIDDKIDFALKTWWDYHFNGSEKIYYKYIVGANNNPGVLSEINVLNGGTGYSNSDDVVITANVAGSGGTAHIVTDGTGKIVSCPIDAIGGRYSNEPTATITSNSGSNAVLQCFNGGYIPMPQNVLGAINIFDFSESLYGGSANMFNVQYQIALNDIYNMTSLSMVPYFMARMQIAQIAELLVGKQPIRYNRHKNKIYLDMDWNRLSGGGMVVVEAYRVVNPDDCIAAWSDRWLLQYCTALIKQVWGNNLKKYSGMELPGKITFNGQQIYNEATNEIQALEHDMIRSYSLPVLDMIG